MIDISLFKIAQFFFLLFFVRRSQERYHDPKVGPRESFPLFIIPFCVLHVVLNTLFSMNKLDKILDAVKPHDLCKHKQSVLET